MGEKARQFNKRSLCPFAMTDKENALCHFVMTAHSCHFELSLESEKSIEFQTHFKFKMKNPHFKGVNLRFKFVDTSLRSV